MVSLTKIIFGQFANNQGDSDAMGFEATGFEATHTATQIDPQARQRPGLPATDTDNTFL
jgi:hypothetical protein